jgi:hypothetical protein
MSVSSAIITNMKQDILMVPNSAIKTQGNTSYVELFDTPLVSTTAEAGATNTGIPSAVLPRQQTVVTGLSNDTMTEIVSGLTEGKQIVTRTIVSTATTASTQAPSLLNAAGVRTSGGTTRSVTGR